MLLKSQLRPQSFLNLTYQILIKRLDVAGFPIERLDILVEKEIVTWESYIDMFSIIILQLAIDINCLRIMLTESVISLVAGVFPTKHTSMCSLVLWNFFRRQDCTASTIL